MRKIELALVGILLIVGFVARLYKIENPVADWHSWRQADTSAVSRNFVKFGMNLFLPRFDDFSDTSGHGLINPSGFRMVEFPIFNLLTVGVYKLHPAWGIEYSGRLVSIFSSLISGLMLFVLVRRFVNTSSGLWAMATFLFLPFNIYYSRTILPDVLMVTLALMALNSFDLWIRKNTSLQLVLACILATLAVLVKPVAVFLLLPMLWQARGKFNQFRIYVFGAIIVTTLLIWRIWGAKFPEGTPAYWWLLNGNKIRLRPAFFRWIFGERIAALILGKWGVVPLFGGLVESATGGYFFIWFIAAILYLIVFATGNIQHDYYQIVIIPALSVLVALGISKLGKSESTLSKTLLKRSSLAFVLVMMFSLSWYEIKGYYQINHWEIIKAGQAVQRLTPQDAIIVAPYMGDTAFLYQTERRGFTHLPLPVEELRDLYGVSYFVSTNYDDDTNNIMAHHTVVEATPEYVLVKLKAPQASPK